MNGEVMVDGKEYKEENKKFYNVLLLKLEK